MSLNLALPPKYGQVERSSSKPLTHGYSMDHFPIECMHGGVLMDFILNFSWIHNGFLMEIGRLQCWEWCMVKS
jgi:hypothetical protein